MKSTIKQIWQALTYRRGCFYAPYMWSNIFLLLAMVQFIEKLTLRGDSIVSDSQFLGTLGFITAWEGVFQVSNYFKDKIKPHMRDEQEQP